MVSYRLTGLARSANAQQEMIKATRYALAPSFSWRPDDNTRFHSPDQLPERSGRGLLRLAAAGRHRGGHYSDANGTAHKLPTDFDEGEEDNKISRQHKMVGYSFSHAFDDTFTLRQNLRYTKINTLYRSVYGNGYIAPAQIS